ncbi:hypothetical protein FDP41_003262 [Naegleria fowleri]|uniref:Uncharacterized protein n=1 Tax=Naegleria fowleri TaxID=5763 RepID=A0A6A5BW44_NAEFO|nr:uncharacterized protein FDP41_003262 [Naegleria fowleri]KAF0977940.1 hypothetical protein FDP41_003262 [Naegleria fowleri]CAG4716856.1 unnamed protein product [Naegleria fowleri]
MSKKSSQLSERNSSSDQEDEPTRRPAFTGFQRFMNAIFIISMCIDYLLSGFGYVYYTKDAIQSMTIFETLDLVSSSTSSGQPKQMVGIGIFSMLLTQLGWIYIALGVLGLLSLFAFTRRSMLLFVMSLVMIITTCTKIHYIIKNNPHETLSSELIEIVKLEVVRLVLGLLVWFISFVEYVRIEKYLPGASEVQKNKQD